MYQDGWMDIEDGVHIHNTILLRNKQDEIMPLPAAGKKLEMIILSELSETGKAAIIEHHF